MWRPGQNVQVAPIESVGASTHGWGPGARLMLPLCCFQTSLPLAALPLWWWYLYNCALRHLPQRDDPGGWPSGKQRLANNRSITLPLCPPWQLADSWILFNSGAMPLGDKAKAAWPLRAATLKQQAMIKRRSGKAVSGKLVWNQH